MAGASVGCSVRPNVLAKWLDPRRPSSSPDHKANQDIAFQSYLTRGLLRGERLGNAQDGRYAGGIVVGSKMDTALFILAGQRPIPQARTQVIDMRPNHNDTSVNCHAFGGA